VEVDLALDEADGSESSRQRILEAAFKVFSREGYERASTLAIATEAKVSKRDLYANFASKHDILAACIEVHAAGMKLAAELPRPQSPAHLEAILARLAGRVLVRVSDPKIVTVYRLAIAEAQRAPQIAETLDRVGRGATHQRVAALLAEAQAAGLIVEGDPLQFATEFLALAWEGMWMRLVLGVVATPTEADCEARAARAAQSFMRLRGVQSIDNPRNSERS
jgi:AcrR family transcriptional regulator